MISNFRWPVLLAAVFMIQAGCKDEPVTPSGGMEPRNAAVTAGASIATGGYTWTWKDGEQFSVYTTGASSNSNVKFGISSVASSGTSGTLSGTIRQTATGIHTFSAAYPYSSSAAANPSKYVITVPASQIAAASGIDRSAYVLVAAPVEKDIPATGDISISRMDFSSPLAVTKISFTSQRSFAAGERVTAVRFSVDREPDLAGLAYYDLTKTGSKPDIYAPSGSSILVSYPDDAGPLAAAGFDTWFTSFPFAINAAETYTITIYTDLQALKGTISAAGKISFAAGSVTTVPVTIGAGFETDTPLVGKSWIELPDVISGDGMRGKAYYAVMKDDKRARNYSILFDMSERLSLWVAYPLNRNLHLGTGRPDPDPWRYDTDGDIPISAQPNVISGTYGDYTKDNMSRGHQIPNADRNALKGDVAKQFIDAVYQTFVMTNVTPQKQNGFNQSVWSSLEGAIRSVANDASTPDQDTLYIVTGPLLSSDPIYTFIDGHPGYIKDKSNKDCRVPDGYFKVILWSKYYAGERKYDSVGFMFENKAYPSGTSYTTGQFSVSDVEEETGFNFFENLGLSASEMSAIKSTATWSSFTNRNTNPY